MRKRIIVIVIIALIVVSVVMFFKSRIPIVSPISGGKVDRTNHFAPKTIKSRNITSLDVSFYIQHDNSGDDDYTGFYHFKIENGALSERNLNISETVDASVTEKVQELIDKYALVKMNGVDVHTSGLPPEYQPFYFTANYDSGEKLYFSKNNDPTADWAIELFDLFRQTFIDLGHEELKPSKEAETIKQFSFEFNIGNKAYAYYPIEMSESGIKLMKDSYILDSTESPVAEVSEIDEDLYTQLADLVEETNLYSINDGRLAAGNDCPHTSDGYYEVYIDYENGKQIYGFSTDSEAVSAFGPVAEKLVLLFDEYMKSHGGHVHTW